MCPLAIATNSRKTQSYIPSSPSRVECKPKMSHAGALEEHAVVKVRLLAEEGAPSLQPSSSPFKPPAGLAQQPTRDADSRGVSEQGNKQNTVLLLGNDLSIPLSTTSPEVSWDTRAEGNQYENQYRSQRACWLAHCGFPSPARSAHRALKCLEREHQSSKRSSTVHGRTVYVFDTPSSIFLCLVLLACGEFMRSRP